MLMPSHAKNVKLYKDTQPIFTRYGIESQLDAMFSPTVQLRSGGYIVLNQTEALVSIDVNSGRSTREHHIEDTALKTNVEAAEEVARQLRLRDLAGLIVIDFIDMDEKRNNRTVERRLKDALRNDRARIQVGRISHFGLMEMSRQRIRTSVLESSTEKCPHCGGTGHVRSVSSVALQLLRSLEETLLKGADPQSDRPHAARDRALRAQPQARPSARARGALPASRITVNADAEVGGQIGFTIDRGEQVMTLEQAKALLAQADSRVRRCIEEEEEPEVVEALRARRRRGRSGGRAAEQRRSRSRDVSQPMHGDGATRGRDRPRGRPRPPAPPARPRARRRRPRARRVPAAAARARPVRARRGRARSGGKLRAAGRRRALRRRACRRSSGFAPPHPEGGEPHANGNGERPAAGGADGAADAAIAATARARRSAISPPRRASERTSDRRRRRGRAVAAAGARAAARPRAADIAQPTSSRAARAAPQPAPQPCRRRIAPPPPPARRAAAPPLDRARARAGVQRQARRW